MDSSNRRLAKFFVAGSSLVFSPFATAQSLPELKSAVVEKQKTQVQSPNTATSETESPIDLGSALRLAGVQNTELLIARERITETMAQRQFAAAQILPNINIGTNYDLHRGPLQQSNGNILQVHRDAMYVGLGANAVAAGSVNIPGVSYNLNVGVTWFNYLQSQQVIARANAAARTAQNDTLLKVSLAYTELVRAESRHAILKQNQAEAAELARLTEAYSKTGQGRKADADRASVELRKRDAELQQSQADIVTASAHLSRLLSLQSTLVLKPTDGIAVPVTIVPEPVPVADLLATALMQRPELEERRAEIRESLYALSSAKLLPFSPNVVLGFSTGAFGGGSNLISQSPGFIGADGKQQTGPRFGNFNDRNDFDALIYFTFQNLGVGNVAIARGAASRARQSELRRQDTLNRIRAEVVEIDAKLRAKLKQIDIAAKAVESSREAFSQDLTRIKGRIGLPIEVIDSMKLLARSRLEYLDAIMDYNRLQFQLYVAIGQPPAAALSRPAPAELLKETVPGVLPSTVVPEKK